MPAASPAILRLFVAVLASLFLLVASSYAAPAKETWTKDVRQTEIGSFMAGKATAPAKLVEYVSYTCPHCAHFETEEMSKVGNGLIANGKANIEIRNYWRDGVDLTVAMLARCGGPAKFFANHRFFMATQAQWRPRAAQVKPATQALFIADHGTGAYVELDGLVTYVNNVFDEMQLAQTIAPLKLKPAEVKACLSDKAAMRKILMMSDDGLITYSVFGTPTFLVNGVKDETVSDFISLKARIDRG